MIKATPEEIEYQRDYFLGEGRHLRIALGETPVVRRHYGATIGPLGLREGARVLELGCGMGRFTEMLLRRGLDVTALDLSPYLIDRLRSELSSAGRLTAVAGRAEAAASLVRGPFDAVVGFFFLHHLLEFDDTFAAARAVLAPGGRLAFCEPNAFNPLYYLQVTFTPGMSWKGEPSIPRMRPSQVFPALERTGFVNIGTELYGALPPFVANTRPGAVLERAVERVPPCRPFRAYRIFSAVRGV